MNGDGAGDDGAGGGAHWAELLLAGATGDQLGAHRDLLLARTPTAAGRASVERDFITAIRLHGRLADRDRRATELAALNDIAAKLTTTRDHDALLAEVVDQARSLLDADLAYLGLLDEQNQFVIAVSIGGVSPELVGLTVPIPEGLVGIVLATATPAWTQDYHSERKFEHVDGIDAVIEAERIRGLLGVPLRERGTVLGALFVATRRVHDFTDADVSVLSALAAHAAIAINTARSLRRLNGANRELSRRTAQLEKIVRWDRVLTRVVLNGGGVDQLISEVATLVERPTFFVSAPTGVPAELTGHHEELAALFDAATTGAGIAAQAIDDGERWLVARPVAAGGSLLGLVVAASPPQRDDDLELVLERAAPALALALSASRAARLATRRARDGFIIDLVTRPAESPPERRDQFRLAGLDPHAEFVVLVAESGDDVGAAAEALRHVPLRGIVVAEYGRRLLALVPESAPGAVDAAVGAAPIGATVGIAGPARGAAALADAFEEAQQTVRVLHTLGRRGHTQTAEGLGVYRILLTHLGRRHLQVAIDKELGRLLTEERRRHVPLIDSLSAFLSHGRQLSAAAKELGVHVNTLRQRLESVDRIIGTDWRAPERALDLQVLLRLRRSAVLLLTPPAVEM